MTDRHAGGLREFRVAGSAGQDLPVQARLVAAAGASFVSALVVNPLDVVKTRMQAQAAGQAPQAAHAASTFSATPLLDKFAVAGCTPACQRASSHPALQQLPGSLETYGSTLDGMRKIVRSEGAAVLWRGTDVAMLMAVPMVGIYLPLYDSLLTRMQQLGVYAPVAAGALARTAAVLATSPLELLRTRVQAETSQQRMRPAAGLHPAKVWRHVQLQPGSSLAQRVRLLWTGVGATLARDVPFSALYWGLLEPIRGALLRGDTEHVPPSRILVANLTAGGLAGGAAAAITTPLDVVKTRAQLSGDASGHSVLGSLRQLAREGGAKALFTGVTPRAARAAPACAIVVASYEMLKAAYVQHTAPD